MASYHGTTLEFSELLRVTHCFTNVYSLHAWLLVVIYLWPWKWLKQLNSMISMGDWVLLSNVVYLGNHFEALLKLTTVSMKIKLHIQNHESNMRKRFADLIPIQAFFFIPFLFLKTPQSLTEAWLVDCEKIAASPEWKWKYSPNNIKGELRITISTLL